MKELIEAIDKTYELEEFALIQIERIERELLRLKESRDGQDRP